MIGTKLSHYEITSHLGSGGMGDVYQATDTKLSRSVAIKLLPETFSHDSERVSRFEREARVLASLNHSNIAGIYGLEESGERKFLVMELVGGETLAERIKRGAIPVDESLGIAKQICEALEAAHEKGIIHRDLKPANVKVTPEGKVKVLDFGLAKAFEAEASKTNLSQSPTLSMQATNAGVILGTAAYMSPEQAKGMTVDRRTDIFAFGCVLYEMLTGRQAFPGETVGDILAAVIRGEPDWNWLPANTPPRIRELLRHCLQKDLKKRRQTATDVLIDLNQTEAEPVAPPAATSAQSSRLAWTMFAVAALGAVVLAIVHLRETPPPERTLRYAGATPENSVLTVTGNGGFAVSPDGRFVAIAATVSGKQQLWLRALDAFQSQPLADTDGASSPFWSPDSRDIGFFAQGKLKKIARGGGAAQTLCAAVQGELGSWSRDDVIVLTLGGNKIQRVPAAGGVPVDVTTSENPRSLAVLPDGRHFLYSQARAGDKNGIFFGSLDGKENRLVLENIFTFVFAPSGPGNGAGHLLFSRENSLMAQPFDAEIGKIFGDAFPVADLVSSFSASENGVLLYTSPGMGDDQLRWLDRSGKVLVAVDALAGGTFASISPDEKTLAFTRGRDIWLRDLTRGTDTRFTFGARGRNNFNPLWSPKGDRIVFSSNRSGRYELYQKAVGGSGQDELLLSTGNNKYPGQWSRDGRFIVYSELDPKTRYDVSVLPVDKEGPGNRKPAPFLRTEFNEMHGQISPDGHWMAYASDESGTDEVYVSPFPAGEGKWRISTAGGNQPRWRGDGKELLFLGAQHQMMAVTVNAVGGPKPELEAGAPMELFAANIVDNVTFSYDVTADGKRFVVQTNAAVASTTALNVVVNWQAGLKK